MAHGWHQWTQAKTASTMPLAQTGPVDVDDSEFVEAECNLEIYEMAAEHLSHGEYKSSKEVLEVFEEVLS